MGWVDSLAAATDPNGSGLFGAFNNVLGGVNKTLSAIGSISGLFGGSGTTIDVGTSFGTLAPPLVFAPSANPFVGWPSLPPPNAQVNPAQADTGTALATRVLPIVLGGLVVFLLVRR